MNAEQTRLRETCIHEAGHAVAAHVLGERYGCAVYDGGAGGAAGEALPDTAPEPTRYTPERLDRAHAGRTLDQLLTDAAITAAGAVAVALAECRSQMFVTVLDTRMMHAACRAALPESDHHIETAWSQLAVARARAILSTRMETVERVADALATAGRLDASRVAELTQG